jgi:type I restriction enzyme, S subunit
VSAVAELVREVVALPYGWRQATLGEIITLEYGKSLPDKVRRAGDVPVYGSNGIVGTHDEALVPTGGIIVGRKGTAGSVTVSSGPFWPIDTTYFVKPRQAVDWDWLAATLHHARLPELNEATGVPGLNRDKAYLQPILLPPLDEQRRIAEVLRSVDEAIAATDAALAVGRNTHRLTLEALFGVCFSETAAGDAAPVTIGQVCMRVTYGFTNPMPTTDEGPWMLTAANVRHGWIDYNSARHTSAKAYANDISEKSRPPIGSVLVTKDGTLGRVARVDRPDVCINQSVAVLIPADDTVDGAFLSYLLQCPTGQDRMLADSGGSSVKHIYISKLAELPFMLPTMVVQRERAMLAEESERAVQAQTAALDGLLALKSHVMSDLLSGRVRVPA